MPTNPPAKVTTTDKVNTRLALTRQYLARHWYVVTCLALIVLYVIAFGWRMGGTLAIGIFIGALGLAPRGTWR